jgi:hypothetical protein
MNCVGMHDTKNYMAESCFGEDHMLVHTIVVDQIVSYNKYSMGYVEVEVHSSLCSLQRNVNQVSLGCICHILRACIPWAACLYGKNNDRVYLTATRFFRPRDWGV